MTAVPPSFSVRFGTPPAVLMTTRSLRVIVRSTMPPTPRMPEPGDVVIDSIDLALGPIVSMVTCSGAEASEMLPAFRTNH